MISVAIMAHPKRERFVPDLLDQLPGAEVVWDEQNDRWDTGRRAVLAYDRAADWHLVVQDDAVLCTNFFKGVSKALAAVPNTSPVSFYTGRTRPYAHEIKAAVANANAEGLHWLSMRGPLWGVAVALPTHCIEQMIPACDEETIPNYDMRMSEWFHHRGVRCWYSIPSLVDHRVGPDNPSLVPERSSSPIRTAHQFLDGDPTDIDWGTEPYQLGDPSQLWWGEDVGEYRCMRCAHVATSLAGAIEHASYVHKVGRFDFLASTKRHLHKLQLVWRLLPEDVRGIFYTLDLDMRNAEYVNVTSRRARHTLGAGNYVITGALRDLRHIGDRAGWSLDGVAN